jgi:hypothetical protein
MIEINFNDNGVEEQIKTEGAMILYLDSSGNIRTTGKINFKAITPIITRAIMEKMSK